MTFRYVGAALVLVATAGTVAVVSRLGNGAPDLNDQVTARLRTTLEQQDPGQHHHGAHGVPETGSGDARPAVICGVRVYGFEPAAATELAEVRTAYAFHFCGVAEAGRPWDVAVKLAGPVMVDLATEPPAIRVVEATDTVPYAERLRQMFPPKYAELARTESLSRDEMADIRRRYESAAGVSA